MSYESYWQKLFCNLLEKMTLYSLFTCNPYHTTQGSLSMNCIQTFYFQVLTTLHSHRKNNMLRIGKWEVLAFLSWLIIITTDFRGKFLLEDTSPSQTKTMICTTMKFRMVLSAKSQNRIICMTRRMLWMFFGSKVRQYGVL